MLTLKPRIEIVLKNRRKSRYMSRGNKTPNCRFKYNFIILSVNIVLSVECAIKSTMS